MHEPAILTSKDVALVFGVTTTTVREWAEEGKLPSFKTPGGHRRFRREDVYAVRDASAPPFAPPTEAAS